MARRHGHIVEDAVAGAVVREGMVGAAAQMDGPAVEEDRS
jgi:hypothetical protein